MQKKKRKEKLFAKIVCLFSPTNYAQEMFKDGAYTPIEHALLRLQLLSEVPARSASLLDSSTKIAEVPPAQISEKPAEEMAKEVESG